MLSYSRRLVSPPHDGYVALPFLFMLLAYRVTPCTLRARLPVRCHADYMARHAVYERGPKLNLKERGICQGFFLFHE